MTILQETNPHAPSAARGRTPAVAPERQFNTRDLLAFVFGFGVFFAVIVSLRAACGPRWGPRALPPDVTIPVSWAIYFVMYHRWGPRQALPVLYSGPLIVFGVGGIVGTLATLSSLDPVRDHVTGLSDLLETGRFALLLGFGLGSMVSFPAAVLMRLYLLVQPLPEQYERSRATGGWG